MLHYTLHVFSPNQTNEIGYMSMYVSELRISVGRTETLIDIFVFLELLQFGRVVPAHPTDAQLA